MRKTISSTIVLIILFLCISNIACKTFEKEQANFSNLVEPIINEIRKSNNDTSKTSIFTIGFYTEKKSNELKIEPFSENNESNNQLISNIEEVLVVKLNWGLQNGIWKLKSFNHSPTSAKSNFVISKITLASSGGLEINLKLFTHKVSFLENSSNYNFEQYYSYTRPSNSNVFTLEVLLETSEFNVVQKNSRVFQLLQDEKIENIQQMSRDNITKNIYKKIKNEYGKDLKIRYGHFK